MWTGIASKFMLPSNRLPLIFESMTFALGVDEIDEHCERYPTEAAALAGHDRAVARAREVLELLARKR